MEPKQVVVVSLKSSMGVTRVLRGVKSVARGFLRLAGGVKRVARGCFLRLSVVAVLAAVGIVLVISSRLGTGIRATYSRSGGELADLGFDAQRFLKLATHRADSALRSAATKVADEYLKLAWADVRRVKQNEGTAHGFFG